MSFSMPSGFSRMPRVRIRWYRRGLTWVNAVTELFLGRGNRTSCSGSLTQLLGGSRI